MNYVILMAGDIAAGLTILLMLRLLGSSDVGLLFFLGLVSFGFALNTAIEFPIALKVGYARMQTVTLIVLVTLAFAPTIAVHIFHLETAIAWAVSHLKQLDNPIIFAGFVIMALSALTVSYRWSIHIYSKEDI